MKDEALKFADMLEAAEDAEFDCDTVAAIVRDLAQGLSADEIAEALQLQFVPE